MGAGESLPCLWAQPLGYFLEYPPGKTKYVANNPRNPSNQLASNATTNIDGERFVVATARRSGFETTLTLGVAVNETALRRFVRAAALDLNGTVIGSSGVLDLVSGNVTDVDYNVTSVAQTETGVSSVGARRRGEANLGMMVVVVLFVVAWVGLGM